MPRRPLLLSLLASFLLMAGCASSEHMADRAEPSAPGGETETRPTERPVANDISLPLDFRQALAGGTRSRTGKPGPDYWQNEATYDLTARLRPEEHVLDGSGAMTYTNNSPDTLHILHMELIQNIHQKGAERLEEMEITGGMQLKTLSYEGRDLQEVSSILRKPGYEIDDTQLTIRPRRPLMPGETAEVAIDWSFEIPQKGIGGRMGYSPKDNPNLYYIGYWYPIFSVYDDVGGWFTEPFLGGAEFYMGYADYSVSVTAPADWTLSGTGRLENAEEVLAPDVLRRMRRAHKSDEQMRVISEDDFGEAATADPGSDGLLTWEYEADHVRDVAFSATTESIWDAARTPVGDRDGDGQTDYTNIDAFWRQDASLWSKMATYEQDVITHHSKYTGLSYPWPHMTAVEGANIIGGGMEFPMMSLMGPYSSRTDTALYAVAAHELAHMWVPMVVGANERRFAWMDEGMTTYLENQAKEKYYGKEFETGDQKVYTRVARNDQEGRMMRGSNWFAPGPAYVIASYYKPSSLLTALRGLLGKDTFKEAYRAFHDRWAYHHPYPYDFFNTFEDVAGRDLDWFWRSFYFETWKLDHAVAGVHGDTVRIEDQGKAYMPARMTITLADGATLHREVPVERWLNGRREATVKVDADSPIKRVQLDPKQLFPDVDRSDDQWTR